MARASVIFSLSPPSLFPPLSLSVCPSVHPVLTSLFLAVLRPAVLSMSWSRRLSLASGHCSGGS